jgi:hypothetical protein
MDEPGFVKPILLIERLVNLIKIMYIQGFTFNDTYKKTIEIEVHVCINDMITLSSKSS